MSTVALSRAYQAAREHSGLVSRNRGFIVVSGRDRASYLQGLLTNDITALTAGQGCYTAYLTAQGRMITDLFVYELGDIMLLALPLATTATVLGRLDQFIFSEDVQLADATGTFGAVAVVGPDAADVLSRAVGADRAELGAMPLHASRRLELGAIPLILLRSADTGESGFEVVLPQASLADLMQKLRACGAADVDDATADVLRIEAGVPRFGIDMDEHTIPLEAGIEQQAISFTKGCYVGQEVIIRVLHRGHGRVARKLVGLVCEAAPAAPAPGTALHAGTSEIGMVTSSAISPRVGRPVALGYVKRDFAEPGATVTTSAGVVADVVALPFLPRS
ncbi:MAG TPA: glycine cleavage T C-terminal barrel domain-containing protein [Vicinamibacterales bacterium]|nr:glycine cleavage T C-terminal barrel domain-containing protein [Vicinamibacterales bacterium]